MQLIWLLVDTVIIPVFILHYYIIFLEKLNNLTIKIFLKINFYKYIYI